MESYTRDQRLSMAQGKQLTVEEREIVADHPRHWHSYFELEILLSGNGRCIINDAEYDLAHERIFFLTPTDFHDLKGEGAVRLINVSFDEEMIDDKDIGALLQIKRAYALEGEEYERLLRAVALLKYECEIGGDCQRALLRYVLCCLMRKNPSQKGELVRDETARGIKKAISFMEIHFREPIGLSRLAEEAGYHPSYFSELFKKVTGETYLTALNRRRVAYARTLLTNGFSVSDACFLSGFGSLSNFSAVFRRFCGTSPGEYRKGER